MTKLELARRKRGLTILALSKIVRVPVNEICRLENGMRPFKSQMEKLSGFLKVPIEELLKDVDE